MESEAPFCYPMRGEKGSKGTVLVCLRCCVVCWRKRKSWGSWREIDTCPKISHALRVGSSSNPAHYGQDRRVSVKISRITMDA